MNAKGRKTPYVLNGLPVRVIHSNEDPRWRVQCAGRFLLRLQPRPCWWASARFRRRVVPQFFRSACLSRRSTAAPGEPADGRSATRKEVFFRPARDLIPPTFDLALAASAPQIANHRGRFPPKYLDVFHTETSIRGFFARLVRSQVDSSSHRFVSFLGSYPQLFFCNQCSLRLADILKDAVIAVDLCRRFYSSLPQRPRAPEHPSKLADLRACDHEHHIADALPGPLRRPVRKRCR
jgi:hypothetical protein